MRDLKLVLRTYSNIRRMTSDDLALLETLRAMSDTEREMTVETLQDKPAGKKSSKKSSTSKSSQSSTKSTRASGMATQLNTRLAGRERERQAATKDDDPCQYEYDGSVPCCFPADANVHHLTSDPNYHEFYAGKSNAPPAPAPSPANGGAVDESESTSAASGG